MHEKVSYFYCHDNLAHPFYSLCRERTEFEDKKLQVRMACAEKYQEVVELRFNHYKGRLKDTLNRVIERRRAIKHEQARQQNRIAHGGQAAPQSPGGGLAGATSLSVASPQPHLKGSS